jgi:hypothetical protein
MINNWFEFPPDLYYGTEIKLSNNYIFIAAKSNEDYKFRIFKSDKKISDILDLNKDPSEMKKINNGGDNITP